MYQKSSTCVEYILQTTTGSGAKPNELLRSEESRRVQQVEFHRKNATFQLENNKKPVASHDQVNKLRRHSFNSRYGAVFI